MVTDQVPPVEPGSREVRSQLFAWNGGSTPWRREQFGIIVL
jgi:hypothetical protein